MMMIVEQLVEWMSGRRDRSTRREPASVSLCPPQIPHDLNRARTRDAAVRSRRLTARGTARPLEMAMLAYVMRPRQITCWEMFHHANRYSVRSLLSQQLHKSSRLNFHALFHTVASSKICYNTPFEISFPAVLCRSTQCSWDSVFKYKQI
jgi:hypothetical protein